MRLHLLESVFDITNSFQYGVLNEGLIEFNTERDKTLLETYLESGYDQDLWLQTMKSLI